MKKLLFTFIVMLLPMLASAEAVEINGIYYNLITETKTAEVTYKSLGNASYSGTVDIPSEVTYNENVYSVTSIGRYAFYGCSELSSLIIPNNVESIGFYAFSGCIGLTSVTIPNSVTSISEGAFSECRNLSSVSLPNDITVIKESVFLNCVSLISITIPNSVTSIDRIAFAGCSGLSSVTIGNSVKSIGYASFQGCTSLTSVTIPSSVTFIGEEAFYQCRELFSVNLSDGVTSIERKAFGGCWKLNSITIPNSVTSINPLAFEDCTDLTSIIVENGNSMYDSRENCNGIIETASNTLIIGIKSTIIPNSVTSIGNDAFRGCSGLTSVRIPNSVASIGEGAFSYCNALISVTFSDRVTSFGNGAFEGCSSLTSVTIPHSVESIGIAAFYDCSELTTITIGRGIKSINSGAFESCSKLRDVYCHAKNVPSTQKDVFRNSFIENATLHVPESAINDYKATLPWSGFKEIVSLSGESIKKCAIPIINYSNGQLNFSCETEDVEYHYTISNSNPASGVGNNVPFSHTFTITVYATKTGYEDSETATVEILGTSSTNGDLNNDGEVNAADAVTLVNIIMNKP